MHTRAFAALAATALLAACGSDSKEPTGPGNAQSSYTATVSGGIARTLSGQAAFGSDNTDPDIGFALVMADMTTNGGDDMVLFFRGASGVPATGQIGVADFTELEDETEIPDTQMIGWVMLDMDSNDPAFCVSTGGTFTVTSSAASRLKGNYDVNLACVRLTSEAEFTASVSGQYDSVTGAVTIPNL